MLDVAENLVQSASLAGKLVETGHVIDQDGRRVPTHTEIHMKAKVSDIPRLVDSAVKNTRLVNDLPTEIIRPVLPAPSELSSLSDEALENLRDDNRKVLVGHGVVQNLGSDSN